MPEDIKEAQVTEDDVQAILDQAEAGTSDLIEAYEPIEAQYFNAVRADSPSVAYSVDSTPPR